jgi:hypothetical protein
LFSLSNPQKTNDMPIINYKWRTRTTDPQEIDGVTLVVETVPRVGDLVEIDVPVSDKENARGSGRVSNVIWKHRHDGLQVTVFLFG